MWDDGLDDIDWEELEDAYGPAVDVPDQLRLVASGGDDWDEGLAALDAGIFHQGGCFDATPVAVGYLIRMLEGAPDAPLPQVLEFLARLSMGHLVDTVQGFDPLVFRSAPPSADYPEGAATVEAVAAGGDVYLRLLAHSDADVRASAAYLVAGLPGCREGALRVLPEALESETSEVAKASLALCCGRHGVWKPLLELTDDPSLLVRGAAAVGAVWLDQPPREELTEVLFEAALSNEIVESFPWGDEGGLAALAVGALAMRADQRTLERALRTRLRRGERPWVHEFPVPGQPYTAPDERAVLVDAVLRALAGVCAPLVFPEFCEREQPALAHELGRDQRELLLETARAGLPLPLRALPWFELPVLERFLADKSGPLEAPLTLPDGTTDVTWRALHGLADKGFTAEERRAVLQALLEQRDPAGLLELCWDLLSGAYPSPSGLGGCLPFAQWGPLLEYVEQNAEALEARLLELAREAHPPEAARSELLARPLFALAKARGKALDSALDSSLFATLYSADKAWAREVLESLPIDRRSAWVGRLRNAFTIDQYLTLCDSDAVRSHVLESLNGWDRHPEQARQLLTQLFTAEDLKAAVLARKAQPEANADALRYLELALRALTPEHRLEVTRIESGLRCTFRTATGEELSRTDVGPHPKIEEFEGLFERLPDALRLVLDFDDHSLGYRLQRLLSELGILSVRLGNSSIERGS
ncbi:MAG: hypothetical protein H6718_19620 [Polyangiaceae bacterium]|nr:hypothetical protein [Polyangiaceae bacterium]